MKQLWDNAWFAIPTLLFFAAGLTLALFVPYGEEILLFNDWRNEPLNTFFRFCTWLGEAPVFFIVGIPALFHRFRYALLIALTGLLTSPTVYTLKDTIGTDRPITFFEETGKRDYLVLVPGERLNAGQTSFPSGHTMAAFGLYSLLTLITGRRMPWLGLAFASTAILVGVSRVFLVQHFLADILGGALFGMLMAAAVWQLDQRLLSRWALLDRGVGKGGQGVV